MKKYDDMLSEAQRIVNNYSVKYYSRQLRKKRAKISLGLCLIFLCLAVLVLIKVK